jgi:hypothetical protein
MQEYVNELKKQTLSLKSLAEETCQDLTEGKKVTKKDLKGLFDHLSDEEFGGPELQKGLLAAANMLTKDFHKGVRMANGFGSSQSESFFENIPESILNAHGYTAYGEKE